MSRTAPVRALLAAIVAAAAVATQAHAAKHAFTPDDFYLMDSVSSPQLSPDGQWVAYIVTTSDRASDEYRSAVWMVNWDGTQQLRLTKAEDSASQPRWSPDGRYLAYLGKPAADAHTQVMVLDRRGGEARALTKANDDVSDFAWSPDGKRLVLMIETDSDAPKDPEEAKKPRPIVIDDLFFKEDGTGYIGRGLKQQLFLFDIKNAALELLSNDSSANDFAPAWSPDGKQIAFARTRERGEDHDGKMDIDVVEARAGAAPRTLVRVYAPNSQRIAFSPDGKLVAYLQGLEPKYYIYLHDELVAVPASGGTPRALTAKLDRWIYDFDFAADSQSLYMVVEDDRVQYPARLSLANLQVEKLVQRPLTVNALSVAGGRAALVAADDATAAEVYAFENGAMRRLTHHGDRLLNEIELGASEEFDFKSKDGADVHGMLVKPPGYVAGRRYPTILWIHGGPDLQDTHSIDFDGYQMLRHLIAADGYVVIGVNYRGSSGRGFEFAKAIYADWGHKEVEDLLAAADAAVARGFADPQRLGIGGWSYGGMLTDYTIASDTRFKAAMAGAGTGNVLAMYGTDQYVLWYNEEIGPPWRNVAPWIKMSYPLFHADRIRTPTLFMGGDADFNVPIAGGEQMYVALRTLGVPTELVIYPDQHHEIAVPSLYKDRWVRTLAWFDRYLKPDTGAQARRPRESVTGCKIGELLRRVAAPLAILAFWCGMAAAARAYPAGYDWCYQTISVLLYTDQNPKGFVWAWAGLWLCGLCGLAWTSAERAVRTPAAGGTATALRLLQLGFLCMCLAILPDRLLPWSSGHEALALLAFLGLFIGVSRLLWMHADGLALPRRLIVALLPLVPLVLAGSTQGYLALQRPDLPWVTPRWRTLGVPAILSFGLWEWVSCAVLSACLLTVWHRGLARTAAQLE